MAAKGLPKERVCCQKVFPLKNFLPGPCLGLFGCVFSNAKARGWVRRKENIRASAGGGWHSGCARKVEAAERFVPLELFCLAHAKGISSMAFGPCLVACSFGMTED